MFNAVMNFDLGEDVNAIRDMVHRFAQERIKPMAANVDLTNEFPNELWREFGEMGLLGVTTPEAYGGAGEARSPLTNALVLEELGHGDASLALAMTAPAGFANAIIDQGTDAQKKALLPLFCQGSPHAAAIAWVEPGAAFEPLVPGTRAEPKGEGSATCGSRTSTRARARSSA